MTGCRPLCQGDLKSATAQPGTCLRYLLGGGSCAPQEKGKSVATTKHKHWSNSGRMLPSCSANQLRKLSQPLVSRLTALHLANIG